MLWFAISSSYSVKISLPYFYFFYFYWRNKQVFGRMCVHLFNPFMVHKKPMLSTDSVCSGVNVRVTPKNFQHSEWQQSYRLGLNYNG